MRRLSAVTFPILLLSIASTAQIPTSGNAFIGYSFSQGQVFTGSNVPLILAPSGSVNMNGWEASAEGKFLPWIGIVADFDWHYGSRNFIRNCEVLPGCSPLPIHVSASRHTILFGPRASVSIGKYTPFVEFLIGLAHQSDTGGGISNSDNTFSTAVGGGLDYKLVKGVAWRVQADSIHTNSFNSGENVLRISTGLVFHF